MVCENHICQFKIAQIWNDLLSYGTVFLTCSLICLVMVQFSLVCLELVFLFLFCLDMAFFAQLWHCFPYLYPDLLSYGTVFLSLLILIHVVFMLLRYGMICIVMAHFSLLVARFPYFWKKEFTHHCMFCFRSPTHQGKGFRSDRIHVQ